MKSNSLEKIASVFMADEILNNSSSSRKRNVLPSGSDPYREMIQEKNKSYYCTDDLKLLVSQVLRSNSQLNEQTLDQNGPAYTGWASDKYNPTISGNGEDDRGPGRGKRGKNGKKTNSGKNPDPTNPKDPVDDTREPVNSDRTEAEKRRKEAEKRKKEAEKRRRAALKAKEDKEKAEQERKKAQQEAEKQREAEQEKKADQEKKAKSGALSSRYPNGKVTNKNWYDNPRVRTDGEEAYYEYDLQIENEDGEKETVTVRSKVVSRGSKAREEMSAIKSRIDEFGKQKKATGDLSVAAIDKILEEDENGNIIVDDTSINIKK